MSKLKAIKVNKSNQLFIKTSTSKKPLKVKGIFKTDSQNNLIYSIDKPLKWQKEYDLPKRIKFSGSWKLDSNHNLVLETKKTEDYPQSNLILSGKIQNVDSDYLSFELTKSSFSNIPKYHFIRLNGRWSVDKFNRLTFEVKKKDKPDIFRFKNIWEVNKFNQITYIYKRISLKTKKRFEQSIQFDGFWQIDSKNKLCYSLKHSEISRLEFRVHLQTPNIHPKKDAVKYRMGIGLGKDREEKTIILYGSWKFSRKLGLFFELNYDKSKVKKYNFSAKVDITERERITFSLLGEDDKPLGINVIFRKKLLSNKDIEFFTKLSKKGANYTAQSGIQIHF